MTTERQCVICGWVFEREFTSNSLTGICSDCYDNQDENNLKGDQ